MSAGGVALAVGGGLVALYVVYKVSKGSSISPAGLPTVGGVPGTGSVPGSTTGTGTSSGAKSGVSSSGISVTWGDVYGAGKVAALAYEAPEAAVVYGVTKVVSWL